MILVRRARHLIFCFDVSISKVCEHCPRNAMVDHGFVAWGCWASLLRGVLWRRRRSARRLHGCPRVTRSTLPCGANVGAR